MSAYIVHPAQHSILASQLLRFNRVDVMTWIQAWAEEETVTYQEFENDTAIAFKALTVTSSDEDIIKAFTVLFATSNFQSIADHYGITCAIEDSCTEEELAVILEKAGNNPTLLPKLALSNYISLADQYSHQKNAQALIETSSLHQFLKWLANLRYQSYGMKDFKTSLFERFFQFITVGGIDVGKPEYANCSWSLDYIEDEQ